MRPADNARDRSILRPQSQHLWALRPPTHHQARLLTSRTRRWRSSTITSPQAEDLFTRLTLKLGRRTTEVCNGEGDKDPSVTPTFDWSRKYTV